MVHLGSPRQLISAAAAALLLLSGCTSANDTSQVAAGADPTPVVTTAPLAVPVELAGSNEDTAAAVAPTAAVPTAEPTPTAAATTPPADVAPPTAVPAATVESAAAEPAPSATPIPAADPAPSPTPIPAADPAPTATPIPAEAASTSPGVSIALGDFDVVNLVTGATQNIADLAPSGPTMLWFWAPH